LKTTAQAGFNGSAPDGVDAGQQATLTSIDYFFAVMWFTLTCALFMCFQRILK
jgi:hypothetical protein